MTSCTGRKSISWRLSNAAIIAILVGGFMSFMFKVAILIEAIKSNCGLGGSGRGSKMVSMLYPYCVALLSFRSSSLPFVPDRPFWGLHSGRLVAPSASTASSLSSPSVLPTSVTISCLVPSPCVFTCWGRAVCVVGIL